MPPDVQPCADQHPAPARRRAVWRRRILCVAVPAACALPVAALGRATAGAWRDVLSPGPARLEDAVAAPAGTAAVLVTGWLAIAIAASVATAALPARAGRWSAPAALAGAISPALLRQGIAVLLGAGTAVAAAGPALASGPEPGTCVVLAAGTRPASTSDPAPATAGGLDPGWLPQPPGAAPEPAGATVAEPRRQVPVRMPGPAPRPAVSDDAALVVRRGDTLWDIAARHLGPAAGIAEIAAEWPRWYAANRTVIGPDPDHLEPGQRLHAPAPELAQPDSGAASGAGAERGGAPR